MHTPLPLTLTQLMSYDRGDSFYELDGQDIHFCTLIANSQIERFADDVNVSLQALHLPDVVQEIAECLDDVNPYIFFRSRAHAEMYRDASAHDIVIDDLVVVPNSAPRQIAGLIGLVTKVDGSRIGFLLRLGAGQQEATHWMNARELLKIGHAPFEAVTHVRDALADIDRKVDAIPTSDLARLAREKNRREQN